MVKQLDTTGKLRVLTVFQKDDTARSGAKQENHDKRAVSTNRDDGTSFSINGLTEAEVRKTMARTNLPQPHHNRIHLSSTSASISKVVGSSSQCSISIFVHVRGS